MFIYIHNLDKDTTFSFASDPKFNLEQITNLVLRDLKREKIFGIETELKKIDFKMVENNITEI